MNSYIQRFESRRHLQAASAAFGHNPIIAFDSRIADADVCRAAVRMRDEGEARSASIEHTVILLQHQSKDFQSFLINCAHPTRIQESKLCGELGSLTANPETCVVRAGSGELF